MNKITIVNTGDARSFTSHGGGVLNIGAGATMEIELDPLKGPYSQEWLEGFYGQYSDFFTVTVTLDGGSGGEGITQAQADERYAAKSDTYTKTEVDDTFAKSADVYAKTDVYTKEEANAAFEPKSN